MGWFRKSDPLEQVSQALARLDDEQRAALFSHSSDPPTWAQVSGGIGSAGIPVTLDSMISIPAVSAGIRLLAEMISMLPLNVYKGRGAEKTLADQTWQYRLLAEMPSAGDFTASDMISDWVSCLEWEGNSFVRKVKAPSANPDRPPEVIGLITIDPTKVEVKREAGEKVFLIEEQNENGGWTRRQYSQAEILHIRGWTPQGADRGYSPMWMNREKLSSILAQVLYSGKFFKQGMLKPFGLEVPGRIQDPERFEQAIQAQIGLQNMGRPFVAQQNAKIVQTGMTMRESQFVEGDRQNMIHVAHMLRIPPSFLVPDATDGSNYEHDMLRLYTTGLSPRMKRIEMALFTDPDLFPQRIIYPEFDPSKLTRTDAATQAEVEHKQVQSGIRMRDEIRAEKGWAPLPNGAGKVVPETPTGAGGPAGGNQGGGNTTDVVPAESDA